MWLVYKQRSSLTEIGNIALLKVHYCIMFCCVAFVGGGGDVCLCVCTCMSLCVCVRTCTDVRTCACQYACAHACVCTRMCMCVCVCARACALRTSFDESESALVPSAFSMLHNFLLQLGFSPNLTWNKVHKTSTSGQLHLFFRFLFVCF